MQSSHQSNKYKIIFWLVWLHNLVIFCLLHNYTGVPFVVWTASVFIIIVLFLGLSAPMRRKTIKSEGEEVGDD